MAGAWCNRPRCPSPSPPTTARSRRPCSEIDWSGRLDPRRPVRRVQRAGAGHPDGHVAARLQGDPDRTATAPSVSWIEVPDKAVPDPEHPAPTITLTAPGGTGTTAPTAIATATAGTTTSGTSWHVDRRADPGRFRRGAQRAGGLARPAPLPGSARTGDPQWCRQVGTRRTEAEVGHGDRARRTGQRQRGAERRVEEPQARRVGEDRLLPWTVALRVGAQQRRGGQVGTGTAWSVATRGADGNSRVG